MSQNGVEPIDIMTLDKLDHHPALRPVMERHQQLSGEIGAVQAELASIDRELSRIHGRMRDEADVLQGGRSGYGNHNGAIDLQPPLRSAELDVLQRDLLARLAVLRREYADSEYALNKAQRAVRQALQRQLAAMALPLVRTLAVTTYELLSPQRAIGQIALQAQKLLGTILIDIGMLPSALQQSAHRLDRCWERLSALVDADQAELGAPEEAAPDAADL